MRFPMAVILAALALATPGHAAWDWPDLAAPAPAVHGGDRDSAVVVGAERYLVVPNVPGAETNAKAWYAYFAKTLGVPSQRISLLIDNDATREQILDAARRAAVETGSRGTVWFVFVGHGAPSQDGKDGLLVGIDAQQTPESLKTRSVRRQELLDLLNGSEAKTIRVVIDACFSGRGPDGAELVAGLQPLVTIAGPKAGDPRIVVLTAAKGDQFAGALPGTQRPAFSYLVLGALRGWAGKKRITAGDVLRYVTDALLATLHGRRQTPDLIGSADAVMARTAGEQGPDMAALVGGSVEPAPPAAPRPKPAIAVAVQGPIGDAGIEWIRIPGGTFDMGTGNGYEAPAHRVAVRSFELARSPVTNRQFKACVNAGACAPPKAVCEDAPFQADDQPVVCVDWDQARAFSAWVGGRLPSEVEWEYAARSAGKDQIYPWGDEKPTCDRAASFGCSQATTAVCSKPRGNTEQGLCDMAGNVFEWLEDHFHDSYAGAPDDGGAWIDPPTAKRVLRGGGWKGLTDWVRAANRWGLVPGSRQDDVGFRPARSSKN